SQKVKHLNEQWFHDGGVKDCGNVFNAVCRELRSLLFQLVPFLLLKRNGEGCFMSRSHKRHSLKVGTMLRLQVQSFDEEVMHIAGSLLPANTGCVKWLEKQSEEGPLDINRDDNKRREIA
ncbi:unnamed protein product, partial [Brassica oleracea var. botrytis]